MNLNLNTNLSLNFSVFGQNPTPTLNTSKKYYYQKIIHHDYVSFVSYFHFIINNLIFVPNLFIYLSFIIHYLLFIIYYLLLQVVTVKMEK